MNVTFLKWTIYIFTLQKLALRIIADIRNSESQSPDVIRMKISEHIDDFYVRF